MTGLYTAIWRAPDGWRWRLLARNGRIIGASSEAYRTRAGAMANFERVTMRALRDIPNRGPFGRIVL